MTTATQEKQTIITKDLANKKLFVIREFEGTPEQVWEAWTESELLDKWWAPKPWKAKQKKWISGKEVPGFIAWKDQMVHRHGVA